MEGQHIGGTPPTARNPHTLVMLSIKPQQLVRVPKTEAHASQADIQFIVLACLPQILPKPLGRGEAAPPIQRARRNVKMRKYIGNLRIVLLASRHILATPPPAIREEILRRMKKRAQ